MLRLYSVFHCNIAFSSIAEDKRPLVVQHCYWPLLYLARKHTIGIEINGYTLEVIENLDPAWVEELKRLIQVGQVELLGSGYVQMIGPLVPALVTEKNLEIGKAIYKRTLDVVPRIAYLNEQTYSAGMPELYRAAGFDALVTDWNNPHFLHPEWEESLQYQPVTALGAGGVSTPVIWTNYIAFQKFQRYAHGELSLANYVAYLSMHAEHASAAVGQGIASFPLYGNDVEIFDFRPGRFKTEAALQGESEWKKIEALYDLLATDDRFEIVLPSDVLDDAWELPEVRLETPEFPLPVKKQEKYNPIRWGLAGRDDITINTECYAIFKMLEASPEGVEKEMLWKELCYTWDSDFRTHITLARYEAYRTFLSELRKKAEDLTLTVSSEKIKEEPMQVEQKDGLIYLMHPNLAAALIVRRGLAIQDLIFPHLDSRPLVRTMPHGYYNDVVLGADYYSGNTRVEVPGKIAITDLEPAADINIMHTEAGTTVSATIETSAGAIKKQLTFKPSVPSVSIAYEFNLSLSTPLSFKTGNVTLNPEVFAHDELHYRCHNGGKSVETFSLTGVEEIEAGPLNLLCSARTALGNTAGLFEFGDSKKSVWVKTNMAELAALPMLAYRQTKESWFFRVMYSLQEFDDTVAVRSNEPLPHFKFKIEIGADITN